MCVCVYIAKRSTYCGVVPSSFETPKLAELMDAAPVVRWCFFSESHGSFIQLKLTHPKPSRAKPNQASLESLERSRYRCRFEQHLCLSPQTMENRIPALEQSKEV